MADKYDYMVNFEFTLEGYEDTFEGSTVLRIDQVFDPENPLHWRDLSRTLFSLINDDSKYSKESICKEVRTLSIAEDSDEIRELREILNGAGSGYDPFTI